MQKKEKTKNFAFQPTAVGQYRKKPTIKTKHPSMFGHPFGHPLNQKTLKTPKTGDKKTSQNQHLARFWRMFGGC